MRWRWSSFPIPEYYAAALTLGVILQAARPRRPPASRRVRVAGAAAAALGAGLAAWSTLAWGGEDVARPGRLIVEGPYAYSRHPMYVAWLLICGGQALALRNAWLLTFAGVAAATMDRLVVEREERLLEREFGDAYAAYSARVRHYL